MESDEDNNNIINNKIKIIPKNNPKNSINKNKNLFKSINIENKIDEFLINKNFDFDKNNIQYSWDNENYITEYAQKRKSKKFIYLQCTKRGSNGKNCSGKAKFLKEEGKIIIYEKCDNSKNNHYMMNYENYKKLYYNNNFSYINMNLKIFQKYYIRCLIENNKISYSPYKLMTLYGIDNNKNSIVIGCLICLKYNDSESLNKLFGILNINYNFNPKCISTDFSMSQIKAINECKYFKNKIYIVPCLFHFAQAIIKKFKKFKNY